MTETEWLTATDPEPMLESLQGKADDRKLRLFAVSCARRIWHFLDSDISRTAILAAEDAADQNTSDADLWSAYSAGYDLHTRMSLQRTTEEREWVGQTENPVWLMNQQRLKATWVAISAAYRDAAKVAQQAPIFTAMALSEEHCSHVKNGHHRASLLERWARPDADSLRCIFGNPFRPITLDPRWQTETVVALATGIYAERAFDRMPILADALEEAGCDHADILSHCRGDGPHVRGCWVVDLVLGKQ